MKCHQTFTTTHEHAGAEMEISMCLSVKKKKKTNQLMLNQSTEEYLYFNYFRGKKLLIILMGNP